MMLQDREQLNIANNPAVAASITCRASAGNKLSLVT
jgi:hypothetical protein